MVGIRRETNLKYKYFNFSYNNFCLLWLLIILIFVGISCDVYAFSSENKNKPTSIAKMLIYATNPEIDYSTESQGEISYILHIMNNLNLLDKKENIYVWDAETYYIYVDYGNNIGELMSVQPPNIFCNAIGEEYLIPEIECKQLIDFFYALNNGQISIEKNLATQPSEWASEEISLAIEKGLIPPMFQTNYTGKVTRLDVCRFAARFLEKHGFFMKNQEKQVFLDTDDIFVNMLYNMGIIEGKGNGLFLPYTYVSREELAKILCKILHIITDKSHNTSLILEYCDSESISIWARKPVECLTSLEVIKGNENGEFLPKDDVTTEQMEIMFLRISNLCQTQG